MAGPIAIDRNDEGDIIRTVRFYTARLSKRVRTADCETLYTIYLSVCTQSTVRTLFERQGLCNPGFFHKNFLSRVQLQKNYKLVNRKTTIIEYKAVAKRKYTIFLENI